MEKNTETKIYKVSVDKTYMERKFYQIEAPADEDTPAFHEALAACIAGTISPTLVERGASEAAIHYGELDPKLVPVENTEAPKASPAAPKKAVEPKVEEAIKSKDLAVGLKLFTCADSGIPYFGYSESGPSLPFEMCHEADEREKLIEAKTWDQKDRITYMPQLSCWVNLSRVQMTEDFSQYWEDLLEAASTEVREFLTKPIPKT